MGEAAEGRPAALVRGLDWTAPERAGGGAGAAARPRTCSDERAAAGNPAMSRCPAASAAPSWRWASPTLLGERLTVVVNTGDDFEHLGLHISPDIDTVALHARRPRQSRDRLGPARRDLDVHAARLGAARRARLVPASATAISPCTSSARAGCGPARRCRPSRATSRRRARHRAAHPADERRPVAHPGRHRRGRARVPALLRARAVPPARPRHPLRRRGEARGSRRLVICRRWPHPRPRRHHHLPVEPLSQHRSDPRGARPARRHARRGAPVIAVIAHRRRHRRSRGRRPRSWRELGVAADSAQPSPRHYARPDRRLRASTRRTTREAARSACPLTSTHTVMRTLDDRVALARACLAFCERSLRHAPGARPA